MIFAKIFVLKKKFKVNDICKNICEELLLQKLAPLQSHGRRFC